MVTIVDDMIADPGESFRVQVSTLNADRVSFSGGSGAIINIVNDDGNLDNYCNFDYFILLNLLQFCLLQQT